MTKAVLTKQVYTQEMHCCGPTDDEATLTLTVEDGGGGPYIVMDAEQWAVDSLAEIDELRALLVAMLPEATDGPL